MLENVGNVCRRIACSSKVHRSSLVWLLGWRMCEVESCGIMWSVSFFNPDVFPSTIFLVVTSSNVWMRQGHHFGRSYGICAERYVRPSQGIGTSRDSRFSTFHLGVWYWHVSTWRQDLGAGNAILIILQLFCAGVIASWRQTIEFW